ncbi:MAG: hypothetical protein V3U30_06060 [Thermoplasmata archaeon]
MTVRGISGRVKPLLKDRQPDDLRQARLLEKYATEYDCDERTALRHFLLLRDGLRREEVSGIERLGKGGRVHWYLSDDELMKKALRKQEDRTPVWLKVRIEEETCPACGKAPRFMIGSYGINDFGVCVQCKTVWPDGVNASFDTPLRLMDLVYLNPTWRDIEAMRRREFPGVRWDLGHRFRSRRAIKKRFDISVERIALEALWSTELLLEQPPHELR